jgi:carbon-monoxide dehydrogenase medium subunit
LKPSAFELVRPGGVAGALAALGAGVGAAPLGGGQSLLPLLRLRLTALHTLVEVGRLPELVGAAVVAGGVRYGAACTHAAFEDGALADASLGFMGRVAAGIAYRAIRTMGTIGGSLALADPAADWPAALLALNAVVILQGQDRERRVAIDDFLMGAFTTALEPGELIAAVEVPALPGLSRWGYAKLARKHGAFADSLAACVWREGGAPRVVLGATTSRAALLGRTMAALAAGRAGDADILADIAEAEPDADAFRRRCHLATVRRALNEVAG